MIAAQPGYSFETRLLLGDELPGLSDLDLAKVVCDKLGDATRVNTPSRLLTRPRLKEESPRSMPIVRSLTPLESGSKGRFVATIDLLEGRLPKSKRQSAKEPHKDCLDAMSTGRPVCSDREPLPQSPKRRFTTGRVNLGC